MENAVLQTLMKSEEYFGKSYSFIKTEHFESVENSTIFGEIQKYMTDHSVRPTIKDIGLQIKNSGTISNQLKAPVLARFKELALEERVTNIKPFLKSTQQWVQKQELTKAIFASADIIQKDSAFDPIVGMITDALKINFDTDIGMKYNDSIEDRIDYYKQVQHGLTTGIPAIDSALGGGLFDKTLNLLMAVSHGGKTVGGISIAAHNVLQGKNVLFVTLEMPEEQIGLRVDANILDIATHEFKTMPREDIAKQFNAVKPVLGKMVIKEFAAGIFNTLMLESLVNDLKNEHDISFDMIVIDYLTLMASSRTTLDKSGGTYSYYKLIAEELHGFAKTCPNNKDGIGLPLLTFAQLNRGAYGNIDAGLESVADSLGIIQTADTAVLFIQNDQMKEMNQMIWKFAKNRNTGSLDSVMVKADFPKMRFSDWDGEDMVSNDSNAVMAQGINKIASSMPDLGLQNPTGMVAQMDVGQLNFD